MLKLEGKLQKIVTNKVKTKDGIEFTTTSMQILEELSDGRATITNVQVAKDKVESIKYKEGEVVSIPVSLEISHNQENGKTYRKFWLAS